MSFEIGKQRMLADTPELIPSSSRINDGSELNHIHRRIAEISGLRFKVFPGSNPVSIERAMYPKLREHKFFAGLKTDGVRMLCLLTMINEEPRAVMSNRRMQQFFEVEVWANMSFFERECLFDGELCWERSSSGSIRKVFLVFDALRIREDIRHLPFSKRMNMVHTHLLGDISMELCTKQDAFETLIADEDKIYLANNISLIPKGFCDARETVSLWEKRSFMAHQNDGLILVADRPMVLGSTDWWTLKWKPTPEVTIDVAYCHPDRLFASHQGKDVALHSVEIAEVVKRVMVMPNHLIQYIVAGQGTKDTRHVLECLCEVDADVVRLHPVRQRVDKNTANDMHTITATLRNVIEDISVAEISSVIIGDADRGKMPLSDFVTGDKDRVHQQEPEHGKSKPDGRTYARGSSSNAGAQEIPRQRATRPRRRGVLQKEEIYTAAVDADDSHKLPEPRRSVRARR